MKERPRPSIANACIKIQSLTMQATMACLSRLSVLCFTLVLSSASALAQASFPAGKPIRIIVPFAVGGSSDLATRLVAPKLGERLGTSVVVDNRTGAGGVIGMQAAAKSTPDGHTLVLATAGALTANPFMYKTPPYDPASDFVPVSLLYSSPFLLVASNSLGANSMKDVVAYATQKPGSLSYASGGNGTFMHLAGELLKSTSKTFMVHVPYRGSGPAVLAVLGGETQLAIADLGSIGAHSRSDRIKLVAQLGKSRSALIPDIPTAAESGLPGFDALAWFAIMAPAGTPAPIVQRLNTELTAILNSSEVRDSFLKSGLEPMPSTSQEVSRLMSEETQKWREVIRVSGARLD